MPDLSLRICGVAVRVSTGDARLLASARRRYAPFASRGAPDLRLDVSPADRSLRRGVLVPIVRTGRSIVVERHDLRLELSGSRGSGSIRRGPRSLDALLRIALGFELARRGSFLCHAAAVGGWLFPGRSGAGKSTLGRMAPRRRLLADEVVGVTRGRLWSTPFWGDFRPGRNNGSRPARAMFFLDRRAPRGARPIGPADALARLLGCVIFFGDDAARTGKILARARRLAESVPSFELSYDARTTPFSGVERIIGGALR